MGKYNVALICGGNSSEWEISVLSGKHIAENIDKTRFNLYEILLRGSSWSLCSTDSTEAFPICEIDKTDFSCMVNGAKVKFDIALIMIHGTPGENGLLQGYFEMLGIPYTTCTSHVSALTFDKYSCKTFLRDVGVKMAREVYIRRGDKFDAEEIVSRLGLPLFVKPSSGGSSFGISKVTKASDLCGAIEEAFTQGETVLVEEFISGREVTQGVFSFGGEITTLPVTEIISHNDFFDYDAKYLGKSDEVCPADLTPQEVEAISRETNKIYRHFGCKGVVRVDYILSKEGVPYFLEVNTVPGMTKMSLVPQQLRVAGISIPDFLNSLLEEALAG